MTFIINFLKLIIMSKETEKITEIIKNIEYFNQQIQLNDGIIPDKLSAKLNMLEPEITKDYAIEQKKEYEKQLKNNINELPPNKQKKYKSEYFKLFLSFIFLSFIIISCLAINSCINKKSKTENKTEINYILIINNLIFKDLNYYKNNNKFISSQNNKYFFEDSLKNKFEIEFNNYNFFKQLIYKTTIKEKNKILKDFNYNFNIKYNKLSTYIKYNYKLKSDKLIISEISNDTICIIYVF